jgi:hypothetical protein
MLSIRLLGLNEFFKYSIGFISDVPRKIAGSAAFEDIAENFKKKIKNRTTDEMLFRRYCFVYLINASSKKSVFHSAGKHRRE